MLAHVLSDAVHIFKKAHVAKLIQLVMADGLIEHGLSGVRQIRLRGCHGRDTGAREAYL